MTPTWICVVASLAVGVICLLGGMLIGSAFNSDDAGRRRAQRDLARRKEDGL